ncbi:hypothetical protein [Enterococcus sp. AZ103]|uniref:hypothetical protein n=1 Tax=Enterococcus sp. AZ103 TaxID=2774628 RepID=UPI003F23B110
MEKEVEKRAEQFANYWRNIRPNETEDKDFLLSDAIEKELNRTGISFENKLDVLKKAIELIQQQKPKTIEERYDSIWLNKTFFTKRGYDLKSGEETIFWDKYSLDDYCQNEGVKTQDFIEWVLQKKIVR